MTFNSYMVNGQQPQQDTAWSWKKSSFKSYRPPYMKVYGCICISPKNRMILVRGAKTGIWSFPKGHLKSNETSLQCALRELDEETSITLPSDQANIGYRKLTNGGYFVFEMASEVTLLPKNSNEISETGWFTVEEIREMPCNIDVNRFISLLDN